jgi:hypothetical protein
LRKVWNSKIEFEKLDIANLEPLPIGPTTGIWPAVLLSALVGLGWLGGRLLVRLIESSFWSLNALGVQPAYAVCREGFRHPAHHGLQPAPVRRRDRLIRDLTTLGQHPRSRCDCSGPISTRCASIGVHGRSRSSSGRGSSGSDRRSVSMDGRQGRSEYQSIYPSMPLR